MSILPEENGLRRVVDQALALRLLQGEAIGALLTGKSGMKLLCASRTLCLRQKLPTIFQLGMLVSVGWAVVRVAYSLLWRRASSSQAVAWRRAAALQKMKAANTYPEWRAAMTELEQATHTAGTEVKGFDAELVRHRLEQLQAERRRACDQGNLGELMFALRADLFRSIGNISQPLAHMTSVPGLIRDYLEEVQLQLRLVTQQLDIPVEEKLTFLQEVRHAFGRTALLLLGAGRHGSFHLGVIKGLVHHDQLPRVIAGSSVGSIVAAFVATRSPEELQHAFHEDTFHSTLASLGFFNGQPFSAYLAHLANWGRSDSKWDPRQGPHTSALGDYNFFKRKIHALLGDLTFQDAYERSEGRILNVCVCPAPSSPSCKAPAPILLNHLTSPHCVVWSAVAASCAFPGLFPAQPLLASTPIQSQPHPWQPTGCGRTFMWHDGLVHEDTPIKGLRELFNVNYFIVAQTNPYIAALLRAKRTVSAWGELPAKLVDAWEIEFKHRLKQIMEICPWVDVLGLIRTLKQQWEGNLTLVQQPLLCGLFSETSSPVQLYRSSAQGEWSVWARLAAMETSSGIEQALDECVASLRAMQRHESDSTIGKTRVPSWNITIHSAPVTTGKGSRPPSPTTSVSSMFFDIDLSDSESELSPKKSWSGFPRPEESTSPLELGLNMSTHVV